MQMSENGRPATCCRALVAAFGLVSILAIAPAAAQSVPSAEEQARAAPQKFLVAAYDVSGVTKLSAAEIERLLYPFTGPDRSNADVAAARQALQDAYEAKGYEAVVVQIPVQPADSFAQGVLLLAVNESPVTQVNVVDARHHSERIVRQHVPSLKEGEPINFQQLQREITEANRFPDRSLNPTFRPGDTPGTVVADIAVTDSLPLHGSVELNNDNSPSTRPLRTVGSLRYTDLWKLGHTVTLTTSYTPQDTDQSSVISGSYNAPLIGTPWSFLLYGYVSNSNVAALGGTNVLGDGWQVGARAVYRLPAQNSFQSISFGLDYKDFNEQVFLGGQAIRPAPIRYLPLVVEYTAAGNSDIFNYTVVLGATAGLRVVKKLSCVDAGFANVPDQTASCLVNATTVGFLEDQFQGRSLDARENFLHLNLDATLIYDIPGGYSASWRFAGQLSDGTLITNEQFSLGGMSSVRGYYVSESIGDDGFVQQLEFRSKNIGRGLVGFVNELRLFAFTDFGFARIRRPAIEQTGTFRLISAGGGARMRLFRDLSGEALIGVPLRDGPNASSGEPRYNFSLKAEF